MTAPPEPAPAPADEPLAEPRRDWDETPSEAARRDDRYWDALYDRGED